MTIGHYGQYYFFLQVVTLWTLWVSTDSMEGVLVTTIGGKLPV